MPESFEFWFLGPEKVAVLEKEITYSKKIAENHCYHLVDGQCLDSSMSNFPDPKVTAVAGEIEYKPKDNREQKYLSNFESDSIECDKSNHFDVFCGKTKNETQSQERLEIWFDISHSMKDVDFPDKSGDCFRKSFITRLKKKCSKVGVQLFDTGIKSMGDLNSLCTSNGLSDDARLVKWIKDSTAKRIIIITDKHSMSKKIGDFVFLNAGKTRGDKPKENMSAKDLLLEVDKLASYCK